MASLDFDIQQLYNRTFGSTPYVIPHADKAPAEPPNPSDFKIDKTAQKAPDFIYNGVFLGDGSMLSTNFLGTEIWLPTILREIPNVDKYVFKSPYGDGTLFLPYAVVRITSRSSIIRTPLVERRGTVKELYNIEDYSISLRGFVIDNKRIFPHEELKALKMLFELGSGFRIDNALVNQFLASTDRVVITGFDLPEVEGGRKHVRPFSIQMESDSVFELEWAGNTDASQDLAKYKNLA